MRASVITSLLMAMIPSTLARPAGENPIGRRCGPPAAAPTSPVATILAAATYPSAFAPPSPATESTTVQAPQTTQAIVPAPPSPETVTVQAPQATPEPSTGPTTVFLQVPQTVEHPPQTTLMVEQQQNMTSVCGDGQVVACCSKGDTDNGGLLGGLLSDLLGGNCDTVALNILGTQNIQQTCGSNHAACCTGDEQGLTNAPCNPIAPAE